MNLRDLMEQPEGGEMIAQIARQLGIDEQTARQGVAQLAPAVARGMQRNAGQAGGLGALLEALTGGSAGTGQASAGLDGNDVLGQIFGNKDVSRNVAGYASSQSGIDSSLLKKMLPLIASALVMYLSKSLRQGGGSPAGGTPQESGLGSGMGGPRSGAPGEAAGASGGSLTDMLGQMLDADRDGSAVDDLLDMARKYF